MPHECETGYIVHPVTLDLCCQLMWVLRGYGESGTRVTTVPSHLKHLSVTLGQNLGIGADLQLWGSESGTDTASNPVNNCITVTHPDNPTQKVIEIRDMTLVPISNDIQGSKDNTPNPICYKLHYEPCFDMLSGDDYRQLNRPKLDDGNGHQRMSQLEKVATYWLKNMLRSVPEQELPSFDIHHQKFYRWAQRTCIQAGSLEEPTLDMIQQTREVNGAGRLACKVGELLPRILRGELDALTVMHEDDGLSRYYQDLDGLREAYANASVCIDKMAHQNPNLNILEIGAGTGGATLPILQILGGNEPGSTPRFGRYTYTDISPAFFEKAKEKFADWGHLMTYQTLDISVDPMGQNFTPESYDLVVACNVLHATANINETMANIRWLLKPGGKVLLIEETVSKARHMPFALLPGWWLACDEVRPDGPLLTVDGWNNVMKSTDFS